MKIKNILKTTTLSIGIAALFNKYLSYSSNLNNEFNKNKYEHYDSEFGNITYTKTGEGEKLLLIHNLSEGDNINEWNYIIKYLSNNFCVYTINLLGCGNSDKSNIIYTNFMYAKLIIDFIENIIKDKTIIITSGNSNYIAVSSELYKNGTIEKIIMINPSKPKTIDYNKIFTNIIKLPLIGTLVYYAKFSRRNMLKKVNTNYRLYEYLHSKYDSIHYDYGKSKYLYTSIVEGKLNIDIEKTLAKIDVKTYSYIDNNHIYPHIEEPEKVANFIKKVLTEN